jgi:Fe-S-cluster-containing dehydrogenase component
VTKDKKTRFIVQYPPEISLCTGCSSCEVVCGLVHEGKAGPAIRRIFLERDTISLAHRVHTCQHCADHPCYDACPRKNEAMFLDEAKGIVFIEPEGCIGCKQCIDACGFEPRRINFDNSTKKAVKCDLCRNRPKGPACVEFCQVLCIGINDEPLPPHSDLQ